MMQLELIPQWQTPLNDYLYSEQYQQLSKTIEAEYHKHTVYPAKKLIFRAFNLTPYNQVKVCILGQDPYHGDNQANGLAFSVQPQIKLPPSLRNIYKELETDLGIHPASHGELSSWAKQGVLLLNTVLTVRAHEANSHRGLGWEELTDLTIARLNQQNNPVVFILWGKQAQQKEAFIDTNKHAIIKSVHPSPLSAYRGFFGSQPFSRTNDYLDKWDMTPIDWQLPPVQDLGQMQLF